MPSTAQDHIRTKHTFTVTPYQVLTKGTRTQAKNWFTALCTTQQIANTNKPPPPPPHTHTQTGILSTNNVTFPCQ